MRSREAILAEIRARRELLKAIGRPHRRRGPLPHQQQPDAVRLGYFRALLQVLGQARALVKRVEPRLEDLVRQRQLERGDAHLDMSDEELNDLLDKTSDEFFAEFTNTKLAGIAEQYARRTSGFQREQLARQFKNALGIDIIKAEPWLEPRIREFTAENVALIKSIPQRYFEQVEQRVIRGMREGLRWEEIAKNLDERFEVAEGHAKLVARDQVGKFFGELNRQRQKDLGITDFIWRTARDNRVREEHAALEGEKFQWDDPPAEGIPGQAINCRCEAEPVLGPILEAVEGPSVAPQQEVLAPPSVAPAPLASGGPPLTVEQLAVKRDDIIKVLPYQDAEAWHKANREAAIGWRRSLSQLEGRALDSYQGSGYSSVNGQLRSGSIHSHQLIDELTKALDRAPALPTDVWVWRGFRYPDLARRPLGVLESNGNFLNDRGFVSTSIHAGQARGFAGSDRASGVLMHVRLPAGSRASYLTGRSGNAYEYEVLLQRDAKFRVTRVMKTADDYIVMEGEYVGSKPTPLPSKVKTDSAKTKRPPERPDKFCWTEEDFESGGVYFSKE